MTQIFKVKIGDVLTSTVAYIFVECGNAAITLELLFMPVVADQSERVYQRARRRVMYVDCDK